MCRRKRRGEGRFQPGSRGLTRRWQAYWRSRMRVCGVFMGSTLTMQGFHCNNLRKYAGKSRIKYFSAILSRCVRAMR
ncbi:hypothetical protein FM069_04130 [Pseudomonas mangiferae]|uniref:Uncharacterized protein n=1 Tax=Pseudomonas mangiferae TaxID=2593654 RepID=A0A553H3Q1_9PSED|nr:hypothetical protein FM069_04130 [Pseudomonas mangiferae]